MTMTIAASVPEILHRCAEGVVPVNVDTGLAIKAHRQAPSANMLFTVILARQPTVEGMRRQLDYLVGLPIKAWEGVPDWEEHREGTLAAISRAIAWMSVCV
jgi:hypothetical protein